MLLAELFSQCLLYLPVAASLCFIITAFFRCQQLQKLSIKIPSDRKCHLKFILGLALLVYQSCIVGCSLNVPVKVDQTVSEALHLVAIALISTLSPLEHTRSVKPSKALVIYLSVRTFSDASVLLFTRDRRPIIVLAVRTALEAGSLVAESQNKRSSLFNVFLDLAPEETAGPWSNATFWWINTLLFSRQTSVCSLESLPQNPCLFEPSILRQKILLAWSQRAKPEGQLALPLALVQCLLPEFATIVPTRLLLIVLRYAQPLLISQILQLLATSALNRRSYRDSCTIVIVSAMVYVGQAIISSRYKHQLNRLKVMTRTALVELIYQKTLDTPSSTYKDYSAITLMSTDADALGNVSEMFHESWAQVLEVVVGMVLLAQQLGWFCLVPLPLIFACSRITRHVASNLRPKQQAWNKATQDRINKTISIIRSIKVVKILGLTRVVESEITSLRESEIEMSKNLRWVSVLANTSANALGLFTPAITIILFAALDNSTLDAETAYTTLAVLVLVTHPANMIMTIVPRAIASLASFQRLQDFVGQPHLQDARILLKQQDRGATSAENKARTQTAVEFKDVVMKSTDGINIILSNINLQINRGSIVVCTGPTGVGKSTLALAIAGEIIPSEGSVSVISRKAALCAQSPWLSGTSVPEMIRGPHENSIAEDKVWYQQVLDACCIDDCVLSQASECAVSGHARLSGGQRQRVALARAVYQRCDILILDDPFSALDQRTQDRIIFNLMGPNGLLRSMATTVFLITNAVRAYPLTDKILLLGKTSIEFDGDWTSYSCMSSPISSTVEDYTEPSGADEQGEFKISRGWEKLAAKDEEFDIDKRPGGLAVYAYYLRSVGPWNMITLLACTSLYSFFSIFPHYWLKWWTESEYTKSTYYIVGYLLLSFIAWISTSGTLWVNFINLAPRSGAALHASLLGTVLGAPLSYFLNNDSGTIVNRFGQDIQLIDRDLPSALAALCTQIFKLLMQCSLLLVSERLLILALPIYIIFVYIIQKVYLRTSRHIRYLELESRSAVYSSFLETVDGLATIRALGWRDEYLKQNTKSLDLSQRAFYYFLCLQRWLNVVLDLAVAVIAIVAIGLAVFFANEKVSADVGIALNMVLVANTTLLRLVESWTTLEVSVGAAARLKEVEDTVASEEDCAIDIAIPRDWPSAGTLSLKHVRVCYGTQMVLNDLNFEVRAGQKVFICGETGSGKSTLLMALLRLCQTQRGSIRVDGIEVSQASPSIIREKCFIAVPQDAFCQPNTSLRDNLDPYSHHSSREILIALQKLQLWNHFKGTDPVIHQDDDDDDQILASPLSSFPPMSTGQLQVMSLARAILASEYHRRCGRRPIILLDEPAANLDGEFETLSSRIIEEELTAKGHTVLMITHSTRDLQKKVRAGKDTIVRIRNGLMEVVAGAE